MERRLQQRAFAAASCILSLQLSSPAGAQTTVLMGSATKTDVAVPQQAYSQPLIEQQARYDTRYVAPPQVRVVRPVYRTRTVYVRDNRTYFQRHPKVKAAVVGGGVGAAAGAVTGLVSGRGVLRGAAIGAGAGAGIGLIRSSRTMKRHPIIRDVATGTVAGLGLGWAASRSRRTIGKATAVGAAVGLGVGLFKHLQ